MSLTGVPLLVLLGVLALAAPLGVWAVWPHLRGTRAVRAAGRIGLVLAPQLVAVGFVAGAVNDYGAFYTTWGDLLGVTPAHVGTVRGYGAPASSGIDPAHARIHGYPTTSWSTPARWPTSGAVVSLLLAGARTGIAEPALVYLPPAYFAAHNGPARLPIVETFTGFPGQPTNLLTRLHYPRFLLAGIRAGQVQQMALVMMRPTVGFPRDTECLDIAHGPRSLTYFAQDVPAAVANALGLEVTAAAAIGDSSGGYCALHLAMTHPRAFRAAASLSGYYRPVPDASTGDLFAGSSSAREQADLEWRLRHLPVPPISVLVATSPSESGYEGYAAAQHFLGLVRAPMSAQEVVVAHGGHNFDTWSLEIPRALAFLSRNL